MNSKTSLIAAAFGFAVLSVSAQAAHLSQVNKVKAGDSQEQVIQALGKPLNTPSWFDGSHSLVYSLPSALEPTRVAYVNVGPDNKVISVQFGNDGVSN